MPADSHAAGLSFPPLPEAIHELALQTIHLVYEEQFSEALQTARRIVRTAGDHPAGYFFCASVLDAHMAFEMSSRFENDFYRYCNEAIERGETRLSREPDDVWSRFFVGGAEGLKGNYESRYQRWITAFRSGWKGVSILRRIQDVYPAMADLRYGIGTYRYWRSAMTDVMRWMPGVKDERHEGIEDLRTSFRFGLYTAVASGQNLLEVYLNEELFAQVVSLADSLLSRYPENTSFRWHKARALIGMGDYQGALGYLIPLRERFDQIQTSHFNSVTVRCSLIRAYMGLNETDSAHKMRNEIRQFEVPSELQRQAQLEITTIDQLLQGR